VTAGTLKTIRSAGDVEALGFGIASVITGGALRSTVGFALTLVTRLGELAGIELAAGPPTDSAGAPLGPCM
jgi:hypothetical protein